MKRIYLIDCPGVVPPSNNDTPQDILLRGVVRVENVENPEQYIPAVLAKTKPQHIERTYNITGYADHIEFLEVLARKGGRLLHGGEADVDGVAKQVLNDFLRGKIPWFTPPPLLEAAEEKEARGVEGRAGRLGEMGKRKRAEDPADSVADTSMVDAEAPSTAAADEDFEGFNSDGGAKLDEDDVDNGSDFDNDSDDESEVEADLDVEEDNDTPVSNGAEEQLREELEAAQSRKMAPVKKRRRKN